ncbi:MAG: hypothetical protein ACREBR_00335 [bacterium]
MQDGREQEKAMIILQTLLPPEPIKNIGVSVALVTEADKRGKVSLPRRRKFHRCLSKLAKPVMCDYVPSIAS